MKTIDVFFIGSPTHLMVLNSVVEILNTAQHFVKLVRNENVPVLGFCNGESSKDSKVINSPGSFRINSMDWFDAIQLTSPSAPTIYVTSVPFVDNYYSHEHQNISIITLSDWELHFSPPSLRAFLLYQFAQAILTLEVNLPEEKLHSLAHDDSVGCVFDFVEVKDDIKIGMKAGCICPQCESMLRQYGVDSSLLNAAQSILNCVRDESLGRRKQIRPKTAFMVMRFSSNDENDNAYKHGIKQGAQEVGIVIERADKSVITIALLEKIINEIETSHFVVVKADTDNLNVYFELGLAMGMRKNILLISESSLVLNVPTDLKNINFLTYPQGNYDKLKESVVKFFKDNYGL